MNKTPIKRPKSKLRRHKEEPILSVIMPVYNAEKYLKQAIKSVLAQTFKKFELIIMDDASTDSSWDIITKLARRYPTRIRTFQSEKHVGRAATLMRQIALCRGEFIARMDATDIALPERFKTQISYLANNPKTIACGGQCLVINEAGKITGEKKLPTSFDDIYKYILKFCPALQPTIMIAKKRLPYDFEYYNTRLYFAESLEFLFRIFKYGRVENVSEYILLQRQVDKNLSQTETKKSEIIIFLSHLNAIINYGYRPNASGVLYSILNLILTLFVPKRVQNYISKHIKIGSITYPVSRKILRKYSYLGLI